MKMEELKNYDDKLIYIIIFNVAFTLLLNNPTTFIENSDMISIILTVPALYLPIYIINNLFSREWKFKILYPENESHRFAYGIFTKLQNNTLKYDPKLIDVDLILKIHGKPKTEPKEDKLWYKIYKKHRYDNKIYQQNRQFLFCRDSLATVLIITLIFSILAQVFGFEYLIVTIVSIGIIESIIFWILAREHNKTLALSVLQEETDHLKRKESILHLNFNNLNYNT